MANKDAYYFSHDSNALTDPKILSMRCDYGLEGYGLYWSILEMLRNESNYKLTLNKNTFRAIKMQTATTIDVERFIYDCINEYKDDYTGNGLFNSSENLFWSESFLRRMEKYEEIKEKRSNSAKVRWNKKQEKETKKIKLEEPKKSEESKIFGEAEQQKNNQKMQNIYKCIKKICKSNTNAYKKIYKSNAKSKKVYAKICKLNEIKLNEIKLNKIKSIYLSNQKEKEKVDSNFVETEKIDFEKILDNCELHIFDNNLAREIKIVLREMFFDFRLREKIKILNSKMLLYALDKFSKANSQQDIKNAKAYFKTCILTAIDETELSSQYDTKTIYATLSKRVT